MEIHQVTSIDDGRLSAFRDIPDPTRLRELGNFVVEGRLAVHRLLAEDRFRVKALLVTSTTLQSLANLQSFDMPECPVYVASRDMIKHIGGFDFHQGCLGLVERPSPEPLQALLRRVTFPKPIIVLEQVGNADNIGGIFRNAAAFGAAGILMSPGCCDPLYRKAIRTSIATTLQIPYAVVEDWPAGLESVRRHGYELVALTPDADAVCLNSFEFFKAGHGTGLILGNEGDGLSAPILEVADARVRIPLEPVVDSLNVATTAAIVLCHLSQFGERLGAGNNSQDGR